MFHMPNENEHGGKPARRRKVHVIKARVSEQMKRDLLSLAAEREETEANVIRAIIREALAKRGNGSETA